MNYREALAHAQQLLRQRDAAMSVWDAMPEDSLAYRAQRKLARSLSDEYQKAFKRATRIFNAEQRATAQLPPPKPNAQVLATAQGRTSFRDGLGWGFEHHALEQDQAYKKWQRKAARKLSDLE